MFCSYPPPYFWILHIDGSAMPNPGRMAIGAVLTGPDGSQHCLGQTLPGAGCNNEAELRAVLAGLHMALSLGARHVRIYTDSRWLVDQLADPSLLGSRIRPTLRLSDWLQKVRDALESWEQVEWRWIPRRCNAQADALARAASLATLENQKAELLAQDQ